LVLEELVSLGTEGRKKASLSPLRVLENGEGKGRMREGEGERGRERGGISWGREEGGLGVL